MKAMDWDSYYTRPYRTATFTRKHTASVLVQIMRESGGRDKAILELGGANSCFIDHVLAEVQPKQYDVVDLNTLGIQKLKGRYPNDKRVDAKVGDVLSPSSVERKYDFVYSVGLIEHFAPEQTALAIASHFAYVVPNGTVIVTFPTPTWLYRTVRFVAELSGQWIFHDERPLRLDEFNRTAEQFGTVTSAHIMWPVILTQYCCVVKVR
jgi:Methyltransferase domain